MSNQPPKVGSQTTTTTTTAITITDGTTTEQQQEAEQQATEPPLQHPRSRCSAVYVILSLGLIAVAGPSSAFALSVLVVPHEQEFNITRTESAILISYRTTIQFVMCGIFGFLFTKLPPKAWIIIGACTKVAGLMAASLAPDFFAVCMTFGALSAVGTGIMYGTTQFLIPLYFPQSVTLVTGITFSGIGIGSLIWSNMMSILIERFGWRITSQIMSIFVVVLCLPSLLMPSVASMSSAGGGKTKTKTKTKTKKSTRSWSIHLTHGRWSLKHLGSKDLRGDVVAHQIDVEKGRQQQVISYDVEEESSTAEEDVTGRTKVSLLMDAILTRGVAALSLAQTLAMFATLGVFGHLAPFYTDAGLTTSQAALVVSAVGCAQIIGRPLAGAFVFIKSFFFF